MKNISFEKRKKAMEKEIRLAFSGVSREGGVSLSEAREIDDYGGDKARREARKSDTDTRWEDVPDEAIVENFDHFAFLDEIGFRYYIPAYMSWCIRKMGESDMGYEDSWYPDVCGSTLFSLDMSPYEANRRLKNFTLQQLIAMTHFLQFLEKEERAADERWWQSEREEWREMQDFTNLSEPEIDAMEEEEKNNFMRSRKPDEMITRPLKRYWGRFVQ